MLSGRVGASHINVLTMLSRGKSLALLGPWCTLPLCTTRQRGGWAAEEMATELEKCERNIRKTPTPTNGEVIGA